MRAQLAIVTGPVRALLLLVLLPLGCFAGRATSDAGNGDDARAEDDAAGGDAGRTDGALGPDARRLDALTTDAAAEVPCAAGTLCEERTDFAAALPSGWDLHVEGGCTGVIEGDVIHFEAQGAGCAAGNRCWLRTRTLPLGLTRITARPSYLNVRAGGKVVMRVVRAGSDWMGFEFTPDGNVSAVSVRGGTRRVHGTATADANGTYAVRATVDDVAHFEVFPEGGSGWVELGTGTAAVHEDEDGALELVLDCGSGTDQFFEAMWGEVGDLTP